MSILNFTDSDIEQRKPVWIALADLFLDTDVTLNYPYIIRICSESPYSIETLRSILYEEVAPVVSINLLSITGEWAGFNEQWLIKEITKQVKSNNSIQGKLLRLLPRMSCRLYVGEHWNSIEPKINILRGSI